MELVTRQRLKPRIYDYCYFTCRNNLRGLEQLKKLLYAKRTGQKNKIQKGTKNSSKEKLRILDVGCGIKPFESFFPDAEYIGIDFTKERTKADRIVDLNKDPIPFKNEYFDLVIVSETMEHVFNNLNLVREVKRVTKKNGILYISTPFQFHQHGDPYDYYRFTEYYYHEMFKDMTSLGSSGSNSVLTTPLLTLNVVLEPLPKVFHLFIIINNLLCFITECAANLMKRAFRKNQLIVRYINGSPVGQYFIFRKR